jgi:hypothetical protein
MHEQLFRIKSRLINIKNFQQNKRQKKSFGKTGNLLALHNDIPLSNLALVIIQRNALVAMTRHALVHCISSEDLIDVCTSTQKKGFDLICKNGLPLAVFPRT